MGTFLQTFNLSLMFCFALAFCVNVHAEVKPDNCQVKVYSNDVNVTILVDERVLAPKERVIQCTNSEQTVRVISSDKQSFVRVIPPRDRFTKSDGVLNVQFTPKTSVNLFNAPVMEVQKAESSKSNEILEEISKVQKMLAGLQESLNSGRTHKVAVKSKRRPSSAGKALSNASVLKGAYLQIHAFLTAQWNFLEIHNEIDEANLSANKRVKFCSKNKVNGKMWTRVYLGPFQNAEAAEMAKQSMKRKAMVVSNPICWVDPS